MLCLNTTLALWFHVLPLLVFLFISELFEISHIRTIYHMFIAVLLIFCLSTLTVDFIDQGRSVCVCLCMTLTCLKLYVPEPNPKPLQTPHSLLIVLILIMPLLPRLSPLPVSSGSRKTEQSILQSISATALGSSVMMWLLLADAEWLNLLFLNERLIIKTSTPTYCGFNVGKLIKLRIL